MFGRGLLADLHRAIQVAVHMDGPARLSWQSDKILAWRLASVLTHRAR
jgi:hypothetical protein